MITSCRENGGIQNYSRKGCWEPTGGRCNRPTCWSQSKVLHHCDTALSDCWKNHSKVIRIKFQESVRYGVVLEAAVTFRDRATPSGTLERYRWCQCCRRWRAKVSSFSTRPVALKWRTMADWATRTWGSNHTVDQRETSWINQPTKCWLNLTLANRQGRN